MTTMFVVILVIEAISLLILFLNVQIFRSQSGKYQALLIEMGDESGWGTPGRFIVPLYVLTVVGSVIVTTLVFVFQPHIL